MNLSRENRLLLYCAQTKIPEDKRNKVKDIIRFPLNWKKVLKFIHSNHIAPLIYHNLKDIKESHLIPKEAMDQLRKAYYVNLVRNMYFYEQLKRILDAFREEGIEVIVLKGAALAETVYDDIGLRYMGDIDLLVREQDLDRAEELMAKLGYFSYEGQHSKDSFKKNHRHLAPFYNQDNGIKVEIHRDIVNPGTPFYIDIRKLWDRAQGAIIGGVNTLALSHEDLIIHLCLHSFYSQPFKRGMRNLIDISQVVEYYDERINWDLIIKEAREGSFAFYIYYALYLAREIMDVKIKKEVLDALKNGFKLRPFEERLLMLAAQKSVFLRANFSSIILKLFLKVVCEEHSGSLLNTRSTKNKIPTSIQILSSRFYYVFHSLKVFFKFCYLLGRNMKKFIFHKMGLKFTH